MQKKHKAKPSYSVLQNIAYMLRNLWSWSRSGLLLSVLQVPAKVVLALLGISLAPAIINCLQNGVPAWKLVAVVGGFTLALCVCSLLDHGVSMAQTAISMSNRDHYLTWYNDKATTCDYAALETPSRQMEREKAAYFLYNNSAGGEQMINSLVIVATDVVGLLLYGVLLCSLVPWLLALLAALSLLSFAASRYVAQLEFRDRDRWSPLERKLRYLYDKPFEFKAGKDLRLYHISSWFGDLFADVLGQRLAWVKKMQGRWYAVDALQGLFNLLRDGAAYALLIGMVLQGALTPADFTFAFGAVAGFSTWMTELISNAREITRSSLECCDFRKMIAQPDDLRAHSAQKVPFEKDSPADIVFDHVSFTYPEAKKPTLHDVSFHIRPGEKVAMVGTNGAGKTTCIKILCGLYVPTVGRVLINGVDMAACNRDQYFDALTAVFQDVRFLPFTVAQNVAASLEHVDRARVQRCLALAGMWERVQRLPQGMDTPMVKEINENAAAFSGGEEQKLVLARALYKDAPVIVLDEPTAALDPIAENEMYQKYQELTSGRSSVFISHRLSSTRFCDRILFLEDGAITEQGSHAQLMARGGAYAHMFAVQSHYYKKNVSKEALDIA